MELIDRMGDGRRDGILVRYFYLVNYSAMPSSARRCRAIMPPSVAEDAALPRLGSPFEAVPRPAILRATKVRGCQPCFDGGPTRCGGVPDDTTPADLAISFPDGYI
jgi:hypothetical protein